MPASDFSPAEYAARLARVHTRMEGAGIETLIVTDPSNMAWITGYDGWSFYVDQAVIVSLGSAPIWWGRTQDKAGAVQTTWLQSENLTDWPEAWVQHPDHHPYDHMVSLLQERGLARGIAVEMDNYYFSARCLERLRSGLPGLEIADGTGLVNWCRAVKSDAELALMRQAATLSEHMHAVLRDTAEVGMSKAALVAEVQAAGVRGVNGLTGDYPAIAPIAPSGIEASASHITWIDRPLARGEATYFEISGCKNRYHCPTSRTLFAGDMPDEIARAEGTVIEASEAAIAAAKTGVTCEEVAHHVYAAFARSGIEKGNRTGYPVGLSYPPDWGERTMSLRPGDKTVLEAGMTFHLMPGLWTPEWGIAITDTFVVTDQGGERLAQVPQPIHRFG